MNYFLTIRKLQRIYYFFCFDYGNKYLLVEFLNYENYKKNPKTYNKNSKKRNGPSEKLTKQTNESKIKTIK